VNKILFHNPALSLLSQKLIYISLNKITIQGQLTYQEHRRLHTNLNVKGYGRTIRGTVKKKKTFKTLQKQSFYLPNFVILQKKKKYCILITEDNS
jgi:hypothetical protein